jgi:hypothetical protein
LPQRWRQRPTTAIDDNVFDFDYSRQPAERVAAQAAHARSDEITAAGLGDD